MNLGGDGAQQVHGPVGIHRSAFNRECALVVFLTGKTTSPVVALMQISPNGAYPFGQLCSTRSSAEAVSACASTDIPIVTAIINRIAFFPPTAEMRLLHTGNFQGADGTVCRQSAGRRWPCLR